MKCLKCDHNTEVSRKCIRTFLFFKVIFFMECKKWQKSAKAHYHVMWIFYIEIFACQELITLPCWWCVKRVKIPIIRYFRILITKKNLEENMFEWKINLVCSFLGDFALRQLFIVNDLTSFLYWMN